MALEAITKADGLSGMDYGGDYDLGRCVGWKKYDDSLVNYLGNLKAFG